MMIDTQRCTSLRYFRGFEAGFREVKPINGNVLFAWEAAFGWSRQETLHLCMGGDPVRVN